MIIGYARVSTYDQTTALQIDALRKAGCERIFEETASGSKVDRPELLKALDFMRAGDCLVVWRLDRLARSMKQLIDTMEMLKARGVELRSLTEAMDTSTANGKLVFGIFASLAGFERALIKERVNAGLVAAKARGRMGGRKPKVTADVLSKAEALLAADWPMAKVAREVGVHRATLYKHLTVAQTMASAHGDKRLFRDRKSDSFLRHLNGAGHSAETVA